MDAERAGGVARGVCAAGLATGVVGRGAGVDWAGGGGGGVALALTGTALWHAAEKRIANPQRDRTLMDKDGIPPPLIRLHPKVGNHPLNTPISAEHRCMGQRATVWWITNSLHFTARRPLIPVPEVYPPRKWSPGNSSLRRSRIVWPPPDSLPECAPATAGSNPPAARRSTRGP